MRAKTVLAELNQLLREGQDDPVEVPRPEFSDALYEGPIPGGARRNCSNCAFWAKSENGCSLMDPSEDIDSYYVCGHYVYGTPTDKRLKLPGLAVVDPKLSGLISAKGGVACDNCQYFTSTDDEEGVCGALQDSSSSGGPKAAHVHPRGCCTRWKKRGAIPDPKDKK